MYQYTTPILALAMSILAACPAEELKIEYADDLVTDISIAKPKIDSTVLYPNDIRIGAYVITEEAIAGRKCILELKSGKYIIPSSIADISISGKMVNGRVDERDEVDRRRFNIGKTVYFSLDTENGMVYWFKDRQMKGPLGEIWKPE